MQLEANIVPVKISTYLGEVFGIEEAGCCELLKA
jgi:hypothetical protein